MGAIVWALLASVREWRRRKEVRYGGVAAVAGFLGVTAFVVLMALAFSQTYRSARLARERTDCVANLNQVGRALLMYLGDNNARAPQTGWNAAITKYIDPNYLACPLHKPYCYTLSEEIIGIADSELISSARSVAAFDGVGGKDSVGGVNEIRYRHRGVAVFLYLDGHTKPANKETFEGLLPPD